MRVYQQADLAVGRRCSRLRALVQGRLYAAGDATSLGFVNILLGLPLFGLAVGLTWLLVRRVPPRTSGAGRRPRPARDRRAAAQWDAARRQRLAEPVSCEAGRG